MGEVSEVIVCSITFIMNRRPTSLEDAAQYSVRSQNMNVVGASQCFCCGNVHVVIYIPQGNCTESGRSITVMP